MSVEGESFGGDGCFPSELAHQQHLNHNSRNSSDHLSNAQHKQQSNLHPSHTSFTSSSHAPHPNNSTGNGPSSSALQNGFHSFSDGHQQQQQTGSMDGQQQSYADQLYSQQQQQLAREKRANTHTTFQPPPPRPNPSHPPPPNLTISVENANSPYANHHQTAPSSAPMRDHSSRDGSSFLPLQSAPLVPSHPHNPPRYNRSPASEPPPVAPASAFSPGASLRSYPAGDGLNSSNSAPSVPTTSTASLAPRGGGADERDVQLPSATSSGRTTPSAGAGSALGPGRELGEKRTLWLGDLEGWMDEAYLKSMAGLMGWELVALKLIRPLPQQNASLGAVASNGYCFLTFPTPQVATQILYTLTPTPTNPPILMPNSSRPFKANWASSSTSSSNPAAVNPAQMSDIPPEKEYSIFVGDLAPEVGEGDLVKLFLNPPPRPEAEGGPRKGYESTRSAKIMLEPNGISRGYGFLRFGEESDLTRALVEMQGVYCLSRPMRLSHATAKNKSGLGSQAGSVAGSSRGSTPIPPPVTYDGRAASPSRLAPTHTIQNEFVSSPLQQQSYAPYDERSPNGQGRSNSSTINTGSSTWNNTSSSSSGHGHEQSYQQQQQQSSSANPLPALDTPLEPHMMEYLTRLAAANGATITFGPGSTQPSVPAQVSKQSFQGGEQRGNGGGEQQGLQPSSSLPSLNIPDSYDPRQSHFHNHQQDHQRSISPGSNISPSSSPYPPHHLDRRPSAASSFSGGIQIPSNDRQPFQPQQQYQHQQQRSDSIGGGPVSPTSSFDQGGGGGGNGGVNQTDPNNTTVFVGGLSSLISEETLKTFFTPFGEITYVKIPPGKGCGFVQFVKKVDAERAIERMQGFPVGGGRIRLSWGRSQYKAAQAAAHAAHLGLGGLPPVNELDLNGLNPSQQAQLAVALQAVGGLNGSAAANANLLRQLALVNAAPGYPARGNAGAGLGGLNGLGGGGLGAAGFGGLGAGAGAGLGEGGLGNLSGLNPQMLQLMAMNLNGLGGGSSGAGAFNPALLARLGGRGGLGGGFAPNDLPIPQDDHLDPSSPLSYNPIGQGTFAPFSPAQSPLPNPATLPQSHMNANGLTLDTRRQEDYGRFDDRQQQQHHDETRDQFSTYSQQSSSAPSEQRDAYLNSHYPNGSATSPVASTRIPGSYSQSHPSAPSHLRSVTSPGSEVASPFDPPYRPNAPPLNTSSSYSSETSNRFFGTFSPPATAPGMAGADYLQQQQLAPSRIRAASVSVHSGAGFNDLVNEMDSLDVGAGRNTTGRSLGYGSFGGPPLRSNLGGGGLRGYQDGRGGGRFDEGGA